MNKAISAVDREWIISCPRCGKSYYSSVTRCEICGNPLQTPAAKSRISALTQAQDKQFHPDKSVEYAGFLVRVMAYAMDQVLVWLTLVMIGLTGYIAVEMGAYLVNISSEELKLMLSPMITLFVIITYGCYYTFYHGYYGQTLGKMLMGLKVIRTNGDELSFSIAFKRWLAYFPSGFLFVGFMMPIFTQHRQALHDKIADTYVIRV